MFSSCNPPHPTSEASYSFLTLPALLISVLITELIFATISSIGGRHMGNVESLVVNMVVEFVDVRYNLFHSRVGFGNAGALAYDAPLDVLDVGGNFVD
jgi:hypothetical protein